MGARERRQAGFGVAAVIVLLAVSVPTALLRRNDNGDRRADMADVGGPTTTGSSLDPSVTAPEPAPTTSPVPTTVWADRGPPTTSPRRPSTASPVTTSAAPATSVPTAPTLPTTPTVPVPRPPRCGPDQVIVTVVVARPQLSGGTQNSATSTALNQSAAPCFYADYSVRTTFTDSSGRLARERTDGLHASTDLELLPGQALTSQAPWDGTSCDASGKYCILVQMGTYTVTVRWTFEVPLAEATATIEIV